MLFAIGDLHLPGGDDKPMDIFGDQWTNHFERISEDWRSRVGENDTVLIPGDISWAMQLEHALPDLQAIGSLPGRKILLKGNHEYWWSSITRVRAALPEGMKALQYDALDNGDCVVCGTRLWTVPTKEVTLKPQDRHIFDRELLRLRSSLDAAVKIAGDRPIVVMTHFPPLYDTDRETEVTDILEAYPVHTVVYGQAIRAGFTGEWKGIHYYLTSCDALGFRLAEIPLAVNY